MAQKTYAGQLAEKLHEYRVLGQKEAGKHRPSSDSTHLDSHEVALRGEADTWISKEQRQFDEVLVESTKVAAESKQKFSELISTANLLLNDTPIIGQVEADLSSERLSIVQAAERRIRAEVNWREYRAENHITDSASYPESIIWHFAILGVVFIVETAINAFFYENAQGLLGGFIVALGVSAINVFSATILGFWFRFINLKQINNQLKGWSSLIVFLIISVYCNALFSSFRSEYQILADPTDTMQLRKSFALASSEAIKIFYFGLHIQDLMSFILMGVGLLLSILAFYKGYTLDDKYPGHGKKDKLLNEIKQYELLLHEQVRKKIKDFLINKINAVQMIIHAPVNLTSLVTKHISEIERAKGSLINQAKSIKRDFILVMDAYRQANMAVRGTTPPSYFSEKPTPNAQPDTTGADDAHKELIDSLDLLKSFQEEHIPNLNLKLTEMQNESTNILTNVFVNFLKEIEKEAEDEINRTIPIFRTADN